MGEWTDELQELFNMNEQQYAQEQLELYVEMQEWVSGGAMVGGQVLGKESQDFVLDYYNDQVKQAIDRPDEKLDDDVEEAMQKEEDKKRQQELDDEKLDDDVEEAMKQEEDKKKQKEEEDKKQKEEKDKKDQDEEDENKQEQEEEQEQQQPATTAMPTEGDDYVGVVRRFWGGPGPKDPTDVSDDGGAKMHWGGDSPIDPWDQYDGLGGRARFYGGVEPTPAEEKVGPKYRPQSELLGMRSLSGLRESNG
jgi:hypothetical protein